jgi:hypothetical protein
MAGEQKKKKKKKKKKHYKDRNRPIFYRFWLIFGQNRRENGRNSTKMAKNGSN